MTNEQLTEIEDRAAWYDDDNPLLYGFVTSLIAEVRRLQWELKTVYGWIESQAQAVPAEWRTAQKEQP